MGRSPCCEKEHTNKGAWTKEEDQRLVDYIRIHGEGGWRSLPKSAGLLRCGKSCRLRWINYLRPDLKRGNFTPEEDDLIIKLHSMLGNKWSSIAGRLPGRTDNEIKNYWNTHIKRKLIGRGIDPVTHRLLCSPPASAALPLPSPTTEIPGMIDREKTLRLDVKLDSAVDCSSSSGTTTDEEQKPQEVQQRRDHEIDLELSIGMSPSKSREVRHSACPCCGLGWDMNMNGNGKGMCRNCQGSGVFFGYYRQPGSC